MNHFKNLSLLFIALFFYSCSQNNTNEPESLSGKYQFVGEIGTTRTYKETCISLKPYTDEPYYSVPDEIKNKISLSSAQLASGISDIMIIEEKNTAVDDLMFTQWYNKGSKEEYFTISGRGSVYSLSEEIESLLSGKPYSKSGLSCEYTYQRSIDEVLIPALANFESNHPTSIYIKNNINAGDSWIRDKWIYNAGNTINETIATVMGIEYVTVEAGNFVAIKIHLTDRNYTGQSYYDYGFEYWVPNVGLVLKTSDLDLYSWNSATNKTIHYRAITRRELISYNFVN